MFDMESFSKYFQFYAHCTHTHTHTHRTRYSHAIINLKSFKLDKEHEL